MQRLTRGSALLALGLAGVLLANAAQAQEKKTDAPRSGSSDDAIYDTLREVINHGADLYNSGDWNGCYRLWEGSLMTLRPMLRHHAELQKAIDTSLVNARQDPLLYRRAWVLRSVLDQIRSDLRGDAPRGKEQGKTRAGSSQPRKQGTLWERLGGEKGVSKIVDDFVNLAAEDPKVDFFRGGRYKTKNEDVVKMKRELVEQISQATGGTLRYKGPDMKQIHKDMGITDAQFNAAAADLKKALEKNHIADSDVRTILNAVNSYRKDVVQPKKTPEKKEGEKKPGAKKTSEKKTDAKQPAAGGKAGD